jgi:hypothetical protein
MVSGNNPSLSSSPEAFVELRQEDNRFPELKKEEILDLVATSRAAETKTARCSAIQNASSIEGRCDPCRHIHKHPCLPLERWLHACFRPTNAGGIRESRKIGVPDFPKSVTV